MTTIWEAEREVPVVRETDVLVCGGGPAGFAAAVTSARAGARTLLIERHPFLGGVWTAASLSLIIDGVHHGGFNAELLRRLDTIGGVEPYYHHKPWSAFDAEAMKHVLDGWAEESGVKVQLYTSVVAAARDGRRLSGVFTESKSGREFVRAKVVVDATGDGDVAARAGCAYEKGRPSDGGMQPMTLYARIGGLRADYRSWPRGRIVEIVRACGWEPSYERVTLLPQPNQPGVAMLMATHLYGVDGCDARDLTRAEQIARAELLRGVKLLRERGGPDWADVFLIETGPFIGVREGRRILGRYYLTEEDLRAGARFEDGICEVRFNVDVHHVDPKKGKGLWGYKVNPYQVPYRCLQPRDVDNLLTAGRCISGSHVAHGSYRVTGDAVALGEAAGLAAALAVQGGCDPDAIDVSELKARLAEVRGVPAAV